MNTEKNTVEEVIVMNGPHNMFVSVLNQVLKQQEEDDKKVECGCVWSFADKGWECESGLAYREFCEPCQEVTYVCSGCDAKVEPNDEEFLSGVFNKEGRQCLLEHYLCRDCVEEQQNFCPTCLVEKGDKNLSYCKGCNVCMCCTCLCEEEEDDEEEEDK